MTNNEEMQAYSALSGQRDPRLDERNTPASDVFAVSKVLRTAANLVEQLAFSTALDTVIEALHHLRRLDQHKK